MNKLLIVGHPASGIQELEPVLRRGGFRSMLPSLRGNMRPDEFLTGAGPSQPDGGFQQVQPGQAWQNLAADLLMENKNLLPWFWASSGLLPYLEFWKNQDPEFLIVMVYDDPHGALERGGPESPHQRIAEWEAYNRAMLDFHRQNPDRCLLVQGSAALGDADVFTRNIRGRMTVETDPSVPAAGEESGKPARRMDAAARFLQEAFLARVPDAGQLYQELQAAAALPSAQAAVVPSPEEALADFMAREASVGRLLAEVEGCDEARKIWEFHLAEIQESLEVNYLETQGYKWRLNQATQRLAAPHGAAERVKQQLTYRLGSALVNGMKSVVGFLLLPVVLLVEILHFLVTGISRKKQKLPPLREYDDYEAAERVKQQLSYRVGRAVLVNLKSPLGWLRLPSAVGKEIGEFKKSRRAKVSEEPQA